MGAGTAKKAFGHSTLTIALNGTVSNALQLGGESLVAIVTPAAWTAGVLAFESSFDGGVTWGAVFDDAGVEVSIASATVSAAAGRFIVDAGIINKLRGLTYLRLASGPIAGRVAQGAARTIEIITKAI